MKAVLQELKRNLWSYRWIIIGIGLYYGYFAIFHADEPNCIIKHTIGFPCPGCGMSRAAWYLLTLRFGQAFTFHPLVFIMPFVVTILLLRGLPYINRLYRSKALWTGLLIVFILVYVVRMILYFPDVEPMTNYPNSWLQSLFH